MVNDIDISFHKICTRTWLVEGISTMRLLGLLSAGLLAGAVLGGTSTAHANPSPAWTPAPISDDPSVQDDPTDATLNPPANSAAPDWALSCPRGSWCVWTNVNGTGYRAAPKNDVKHFITTFNNHDRSAYNNGETGAKAVVYDHFNYEGHLYSHPQYAAWGTLNPSNQGSSMRWIQ